MFEGKLPRPQDCDVSAFAPADGVLRPMSWGDLRARLEAARDLRAALRDHDAERLTSFDAHSARRIAARADGKEPVNPDDLAHGKGLDCMDESVMTSGTASDPRE